jgi:outer membrane assembly lipoprotein YfiO
VTKSTLVLPILAFSIACGGGPDPETTPVTSNQRASEEQLDSLWQQASSTLADRDWRDAGILFERLLLELPRRDGRLPKARIALGDARLGQGSYLQAVREYRRTADEFPTDSLASVGLLNAGEAYSRLWRRPELDPTYGIQAIATWQELLTRYPESSAADSGRVQIAELEEWFALKEYKAAEFYVKFKADNSAILYLKNLVATYPRSSIVPTALTTLVESYQRLGYEEDVEEMCIYFRSNHPDAPQLEESCPVATNTSATVQGDPAGS